MPARALTSDSVTRLTVERQRAVGAAIVALLNPALARTKLPVAIAERAPEFGG